MKLTSAISARLLPLALMGCTVAEDDTRFEPGNTPGGDPWNHSDKVSCTDTSECGDGESCEDGICQMARCVETYESAKPMGDNHYFGTDGEIAIISDDAFVDAFESDDGSYMASWDLSGSGGKVVDVAGGNLTGSRPHSVAVAIEFSDQLRVNTPDGVKNVNIGIWPIAIASGDVDADGIDEIVALGDDGSISVCDVDEGTCRGASIPGAEGKDVTVGDVDGDGFDEPIFLISAAGETQLIVWNTDAETTEQEETLGWQLNFPVKSFSSGDLDGDGIHEIVTLEDGGWWGWVDDKLKVFSPSSESITFERNIDGHTKDVAVGDRDSDDKDEIVILREGQQFELLKLNDSAQLVSAKTWSVTVGSEAKRISMLDWDGDSASGRLVSGPELIAGNTVPVAALMFPPYPHKAASGALAASVTLGNNESTTEQLSDTLSLGVGLGVSFGAEIPGGLLKAKIGAYLNKDWSYTERVAKSMTIGQRYWVLAQPDLHGESYAPVVTSCGCYHLYRYETDDPAGRIGGSGQIVDIYIPVGGQTQLWSSKRYNAVAEATGTLPTIEVPIRAGDPSSYPSSPSTMDGQPIPADDMLFPEIPSYQASDVGFVNFWLVNGETETNEVAETTTLGVNGSIGVAGVTVDTDIHVGVRQGYSISVGRDTIFAGGVPPIPDDPETPEDEYAIHRYGFSPYVYRHHYTDRDGADGAYYVMHYATAAGTASP
jgi:hypothetical protein